MSTVLVDGPDALNLLQQAEEVFRAGYSIPAAAAARAGLEIHIRGLAARAGCPQAGNVKRNFASILGSACKADAIERDRSQQARHLYNGLSRVAHGGLRCNGHLLDLIEATR